MARRRVREEPTEFRFDTSVDPKPVPKRFDGPIHYPRPEGVDRVPRMRAPNTFQFRARQVTGRSVPPTEAYDDAPLQEVFSIHGKQVGSMNEWYAYQALLQGGISDFEIEYQVPWHGGTEFGGQVLDFVISRGGANDVLRVMGHHWHASQYGTPLDVYTQAQLRDEGYQVYDVLDYDLPSVQDAVATFARLRII